MSAIPAVTLHARSDVSVARWDEDEETLRQGLLRAAAPWLGHAKVIDAQVHRWRYATPVKVLKERHLSEADGRLVFAGDAFGGPRVEGAFLSGRAAADHVLRIVVSS